MRLTGYYKEKLLSVVIVSGIILNFSIMPDRETEVQKEQNSRDSLIKQVMEIERYRVIKRATGFLTEKPQTITDFYCSRSIGGKHDFFSEAPYWWPDPANPKGPFIRKDGLKYPDSFKKHDDAVKRLSWIVGTHTSAYILTGEEKYAKAAILHLKSWFIDTATRMNPNMLYAQAINGICTGRGTGIIDGVPLIEVAISVHILEKSNFISKDDILKIKEWFKQFLGWLTTHEYGIYEMNAKNNHGSWWLAQAAAYARLVDNKEILDKCRMRYKEIHLPEQMKPDGSFPLELARTRPFSYSLFNLDALSEMAWILSDKTDNLWNYSLPDGRGFKLGINYILPYVRDIKQWKYPKDVSGWEEQPGQRIFLLLSSLALNNADWFELWKSLGNKGKDGKVPDINPILWVTTY
jgi:hypothetical protein